MVFVLPIGRLLEFRRCTKTGVETNGNDIGRSSFERRATTTTGLERVDVDVTGNVVGERFDVAVAQRTAGLGHVGLCRERGRYSVMASRAMELHRRIVLRSRLSQEAWCPAKQLPERIADMKERRGQQADALAKWADEVDADDLIEVGDSAVGTSMVGRRRRFV